MKSTICIVLIAMCIAYASAGIPGGWVYRDPKSPEIKEIALKSLELFELSENGEKLKFLDVVSAKSQVTIIF